MGVGRLWIAAQRLREGFFGIRQAILTQQEKPLLTGRKGVVGVRPQGTRISVFSGRPSSSLFLNSRQVYPGRSVAGMLLHDQAILLPGLLQLPLILIEHGQIKARVGIVGIKLERPAILLDGLQELPLAMIADAPFIMSQGPGLAGAARQQAGPAPQQGDYGEGAHYAKPPALQGYPLSP